MAISAAQVKALREKTGLPMMDCKKALTESDGDEARALDWLKERGLKAQAKMIGREAGEGRIGAYIDAEKGVAGIVELRCETAPVAATDDFTELANAMAAVVAQQDDPQADSLRDCTLADGSGRKLGDYMDDVFNRLRENMVIKRVAKISGPAGKYVHFDGRSGTIVGFSEACPQELATGVCMHVTALRPPAVTRDDADPKEVEAERTRLAEEAKGKPPEIAEKIINGKLERWYSEFVLLDQPFVKDDKVSVGAALKAVSPTLTVTAVERYLVGE